MGKVLRVQSRKSSLRLLLLCALDIEVNVLELSLYRRDEWLAPDVLGERTPTPPSSRLGHGSASVRFSSALRSVSGVAICTGSAVY